MKNIIIFIASQFKVFNCKWDFVRLSCTVFTILALINSNTYAQVLCNLGDREILQASSSNYEFSGLTYHSERKIFFMPLDDPITNNVHIVGYNDNNIFSTPFQNGTALKDNDLEGLTYLEEDYFILLEEDKNELYFLEYLPNSQAFKILSSHLTGIPLDNRDIEKPDGLEGVSYDPHTKRLYLVREHFPTELFSLPITLPGPNSVGSINTFQISQVILPDSIFSDNDSSTNNDAVGLFHLGKVVTSDSQLADNLLVLSEGLKKVVEFDLILDQENKIIDLNYVGESSLDMENQPEGIAVYNNQLYIASEGDNSITATISRYNLGYDITSCTQFDSNCACICEDEVFTQPISGLFYHEAPTKIEARSNNIIQAEAHVSYNSGSKIFLKPGFKALEGSRFRAYIDGCREYNTIANRNDVSYNEIEDKSIIKIYPNPANQFANITYQLPADGNITIVLLNSTGKYITTLANNIQKPAGEHQLELNASNLPTGIYYLKLQSNEMNIVKKLMITK